MLVRRFIGRRLAEYYAQPAHKVVGRSTELEITKATGGSGFNSNSSFHSNRLSSLLGEWHWKRVFQRIYDDREGHWLTPVELFQPHYSYILGDFCAQYYERMASTATATQKKDGRHCLPFEIVELGGGRGTNAVWILEYLKDHKPHVYSSLTSYTLVDSSPSLHQTQKERFSEGQPHAEKVRFQLKDLADVAEGRTTLLSKSNVPTVVMGMEVLDNLPHDKIRGRIRHKLEQAELRTSTTTFKEQKQQHTEDFVALSDPLLEMILQMVPSYYTQQSATTSALHTDACWIPSVACGVLHHAIHQRPNLGLVMADFDWLPPPDLDPHRNSYNSEDDDNDDALSNERLSKHFTTETLAEWSPIVTDMEGIDHESYLTAPPHCDILFPTDFEKLSSFAKRCLATATTTTTTRPPPPSDPTSRRKKSRLSTSNTKTKMKTSVVRVEKQSEFLERWGQEHVAKTKSWLTGHTPLLHDFVNCSVLTISPEEQQTADKQ